MIRPFNNPDVAVRSWYVVARSQDVARGRVISCELLNRKIVIYRGADGACRALEGRCRHLGAHLAHGTVVGDNLRCAFHHWTFDGAGRCVGIPYMSSVPSFAATFAYPVEERYGAVWVFNGPRPLFSLPSFSQWREQDLFWVSLKPRTLPCHPHVVTCNGLDVQHFKTVHELDFIEDPEWRELGAFSVRLTMKIRLRRHNVFERALSLIAGGHVSATFTTWGGNLATIEGRLGNLPLLVLFTHRPLPGGRSASQTFLFAPKQQGVKRILRLNRLLLGCARLVMGYILVKDRKLLEDMHFRGNLVISDAPLAAFMRQVNAMQVFDTESCQALHAAGARREAL